MKFKLPSLLLRSRPYRTVAKPKALGVLLCYNDADILPEAIESLLNNNHELLVWDHGSDDGTGRGAGPVCKPFCRTGIRPARV